MTRYLVARLSTAGQTDRVILFHAPDARARRTHIRRIEAISPWRHVGDVQSERDDLDRMTDSFGISDQDLMRRAGIDVRGMTL